MLHEIEYEQEGQLHKTSSCLIVKGQDHLHTAMAKTVGLPLGIAAKLILQEKIKLSGLHIPVVPEIYELVLKELQPLGITFSEKQA
jgi:saccharopine dehydrogenase (NADP+, L-glutamate forming)